MNKKIAIVAAAVFFVIILEARAPAPGAAQEPVRVLFVGDIMLDRNVALTILSDGPEALFAGTGALLADADLRVGNLEGTITGSSSLAQKDTRILRFTFDPTQAKAVLKPLRFDAFSLANNHSLDFGEFGYDETYNQVINSIGAQPFGQPFNDSGKLSAKLQARGKTVCLVGYHALFDPATTTVTDEITKLRPDCWRVVVFAHWGEEYQEHSAIAQQAAARAFIEAGADLIVGAHPHVVQEYEVYKGRAIFYSLGNFMFDQNFSWGTTHGLAVRADFYEDKTGFTLTPTVVIQQHSSVGTSTVAQFNLP